MLEWIVVQSEQVTTLVWKVLGKMLGGSSPTVRNGSPNSGEFNLFNVQRPRTTDIGKIVIWH